MKRVQKGHVTLKWYVITRASSYLLTSLPAAGTSAANLDSAPCGSAIAAASTRSCTSPPPPPSPAPLTPTRSFIVDSADTASLDIARGELHNLLQKPILDGIPLLVLGNKSDLPDKIGVDELIESMNLRDITNREVSCYSISAKEETNLDAVLQWLIARSKK